jgi:PIN like domain
LRSKRPSGTNQSHSPPKLTFFTDRDLGKTVPRILRESGLAVERYCDHFQEKSVPDPEWLTYAARLGWVAFTHDKNIRHDPVAITTIMKESGRVFIVRGVLTGQGTASLIVGALDSVHATIAKYHGEAFIATVRRETLAGGVLNPVAHVRLTATKWAALKHGAAADDPDVDDDDLPL